MTVPTIQRDDRQTYSGDLVWDSDLPAIGRYLDKRDGAKRRGPAVRVTLSTFDGSSRRPTYRALREGIPLDDFEPIRDDEYQPSGMTPLLDATTEFLEHVRSLAGPGEVNVGLLLDESGSMAGNRDAVVESANQFVDGLRSVDEVASDVDGKGFLVISTDGLENYSTHHGYEDVKRVVSACEDAGWVTVFLGASIDGWGTGRSIGLSGGYTGQMVSTVNTPAGHTASLRLASTDAASYLSQGEYVYSQVRADTSMRSVTEDGTELDSNIGQTVTPNADPGYVQVPSVQTFPGGGSHGKSSAQTFPPGQKSPYDPSDAIDRVTGALAER